MNDRELPVSGPEGPDIVQTVRHGTEDAFGRLVERHRRELQVHCYRMLGSLFESEDMVQETFLRAWRNRESFEGRSTLRAWLYRIATNACLDVIRKRPRRVLPYDVAPATDLAGDLPAPTLVASIEPYPDFLLEPVAPSGDDPVASVVAKETIELAFLAAIQHLPPIQRAVLILRDVIGWTANDTAEVLGTSVAAVKSALQRSRSTMRERLPQQRADWGSLTQPNAEEQALLERYMLAHEQGDTVALAGMLREDVRVAFPPTSLWCEGRDTFVEGSHKHAAVGEYRFVATRANMQPATAIYLRRPGDTKFRPLVLEVLRFVDGQIAEIIDFEASLFPSFALPAAL
jgi:RNA polymerase sigma-70 factor, ECF subfamily